MYLTDSSQRAARSKKAEGFTVTMSPSSNMLGCVPERTAKRVRAKATVDKENGMAAASRIPFLFLGTSIFNAVVDEERMLAVVIEDLDVSWFNALRAEGSKLYLSICSS
jgi:hypothetical protein